MAYATAADLIARCDSRLLGDWVSDTGVRVAEGSLSGNAKITAALDDASGQIEVALLQGERYSVADLAGLTGNSAKHLIRMTCDVAVYLLQDRRRYGADNESRKEALQRSEEHLEDLRQGKHVFDITAVKDAGLMDGQVGPTAVELANSHLVRYRTKNYYPRPRTPNDR